MASFQEARGISYWLVGIIVSHLDIRAWQASYVYTAKRWCMGIFKLIAKSMQIVSIVYTLTVVNNYFVNWQKLHNFITLLYLALD